MKDLKNYEFWFITGSQHLYGDDVIKQVAEHSKMMVDGFDGSTKIPGKVVFKGVVKTPSEITDIIEEANFDKKCAGIGSREDW